MHLSNKTNMTLTKADKSGKMQSLLSDIENGSVGCALCTYNTKKKAETICAFVS